MFVRYISSIMFGRSRDLLHRVLLGSAQTSARCRANGDHGSSKQRRQSRHVARNWGQI